MRIIDLEQGSPKWLQFRKGKIGGSDIPSIMGCGFVTPYQLWMEKMGMATRSVTPAMLRGTMMEDEAREWACRYLRTPMKPVVVQHEEEEWAIASLDGLTMDGDLVEIKCPGQLDHDIAKKGAIPPKYQHQMNWYLWVTEAPRCYYVSYRNDDHVVLCYERPVDFGDMVEKARSFYECMETGKAPPKKAQDKLRNEEEEVLRAAREGAELDAQIKELTKRRDELKKYLIEEANGTGLTNDWVTLSWKEGSQRLDTKALEQDGINLEKYRTKSDGTWAVRFKSPQEA